MKRTIKIELVPIRTYKVIVSDSANEFPSDIKEGVFFNRELTESFAFEEARKYSKKYFNGASVVRWVTSEMGWEFNVEGVK